MASFFDKIISNFPEAPMDKVKTYSSCNISIIKTSYVPQREFVYNDYHFIIPILQAPPIIVHKKAYELKASSMFPCNPQQLHRAAEVKHPDYMYMAMFVEKDFFRETTKTLYNSHNLEFRNRCFNFSPEIRNIINSFMREAEAEQPGYELYLQSLSLQLAISIIREDNTNISRKTLNIREYNDNNCVKRAVEFLNENSHKNITLDELANEVNYSPYHFLRIFKAATGVSPSEYLLNIKVEKAKTLLRYTDYSLTQVCYLCGFSSSSYFSQVFKKKTNISPSLFKRNI